MTWCEPQFRSFDNQIALDETRKSRIEGAVARFQQFCQADEELSAAAKGPPFVQGSVACNTVIKPSQSDEFDVDLVYPFDLTRFADGTTATQIIDWFTGRLNGSEFYRNRLIPKDRCARINYAGDFHIDVIPSTDTIPGIHPFAVPARDQGSWIRNDPLGFIEWVNTREMGSHTGLSLGYFKRSVRYMKRWSNLTFDDVSAPSSILLTTVLGKHEPQQSYSPPLDRYLFQEYKTEAAYLYDLVRLTHSCIVLAKGTAYIHPTLEIDLGESWAEHYEQNFLHELSILIEALKQAIFSQNDVESLLLYRSVFGDDF